MTSKEKTHFSYTPVYSSEQEQLIRSEFLRMKDDCFLEHAGTTLYSERQISNALSDLTLNTYGNPHAKSISSKLTDDAIDQIRFLILEHFNTNFSEYSVIFTSGATGALKLTAETFQFENGTFVYLEDNHTSVLGMREYAKNSIALSHNAAYNILSDECETTEEKFDDNSLFAYPAQCNFSGVKYPLSWISKVQNGSLGNCGKIKNTTNWFCMLDAASYAPTSPLDLSKYKPDFVCVSFHKIFGYPTGLGALIVKNTSAHVLKKKYFGGGTVFMAISSERVHVPRLTLHERFEDGTVPFLSILALKHGYDTMTRLSLSMSAMSNHTFNLARYVYESLKTLRHGNGNPAVVLYHDTNFANVDCQGGIVNFNLLRLTGEYVGYTEVLHIANLFKIHLRTGCCCNPGACQRQLKLTTKDVKHHFESGHVCGDTNDLIDGYPTGSVRISFGYMSTKKNADTFLNMIEECFVSGPIIRNTFSKQVVTKDTCPIVTKESFNKKWCGELKQIFLYPVKSCGAFRVSQGWKLVKTGLKYDRQWMIVNAGGVCVTQKHDVRLCLIKPLVNLESELLELHCEGYVQVTVPLNVNQNNVSLLKCQSKICKDRIQGWDCGNEVGTWLSDVLGIPGLRLLRQCDNPNEPSRLCSINKTHNLIDELSEDVPSLSLTNQAQFLLINTASLQWLSDCLSDDNINTDDLMYRFRPNFVVAFSEPLVENKCKKIEIGKLIFNCDSQCTRCQMVCVNQTTGEKSAEPLKTLSRVFNGKISFGIYLSKLDVKNECAVLNINESVFLSTQ